MQIKYLMTVAVLSLTAFSANAAPDVKKNGQCYIFDGNKIVSLNSCKIESIGGAQGKTTSLKLPNRQYAIKAAKNGTDYKNFNFTVDGLEADHYWRNAKDNKRTTFQQLADSNGDALTCYQTITVDICHS